MKKPIKKTGGNDAGKKKSPGKPGANDDKNLHKYKKQSLNPDEEDEDYDLPQDEDDLDFQVDEFDDFEEEDEDY